MYAKLEGKTTGHTKSLMPVSLQLCTTCTSGHREIQKNNNGNFGLMRSEYIDKFNDFSEYCLTFIIILVPILCVKFLNIGPFHRSPTKEKILNFKSIKEG